MKTYPTSTAAIRATSPEEYYQFRGEELSEYLEKNKFSLTDRQRESLERCIYEYKKEARGIRLLNATMKERASGKSR